MPRSDTGIWLDEDGQVVHEQPRGRATLVVAKGGEVSAAARARLERLGVTLDDDGNVVEPEGEQPTEDDAPKTRTTKKKA